MSRPTRRKKFIDAPVQGSLVRRLVLHWMLFLIITALAGFLLQVLSNPFRSVSLHFQDISYTHGPLLLVMFFLLPVFIVDTIKLSHRFTGPIFALRRAMREVAEGKPARVSATDGLVAVQIAEAALESAHTGQPVKLLPLAETS